jgi:hypothetical protein
MPSKTPPPKKPATEDTGKTSTSDVTTARQVATPPAPEFAPRFATIDTRNGGCPIPVARNATFWDDLVEELGQPSISPNKETFDEFETRARAFTE